MAAIRVFTNKLFKICSEKAYWLRPLGEVNGYITWLVRTRLSFSHSDPKILIVSGTHGEEIAGPWGLLRWLQNSSDKWVSKVDVSLIPIVNSYGFAKSTKSHPQRYGPSGEYTNCGFSKPKSHTITENVEVMKTYGERPSPEGKVLADNINLLKQLAQDGFLSLHEDKGVKEFYLYAYEHSEKPNRWVRTMRDELKKHFPKSYTGVACVDTAKNTSGPFCRNGLIYNFLDGSFESWLLELGVERCVVPETPGKYRFKKRVYATEALINRFLSITKNGKRQLRTIPVSS